MALQVRRGLAASRTSITPVAGEFIYTTDSKLVYIGDGSTAGGNAVGIGGVPTAITVAAESTDTSCSILFVTSASGDLNPKSNTALTYNSNTASLASTTFVGALTGTASGNLVSGGALGTPSSGSLQNCSGTAASLTAGTSSKTNGLRSSSTTVNVDASAAPTAGQVLIATSSTAATWQTPTNYTNLTEFVAQTAYRVFYSNTSGDVTELALGADGTYLRSNGASANPSFTVPAGAGDMILATVQTVTAAKTFNDTTLLMRNVADTFSSTFTNTATAARTYTLKDASGTVAFTSDITGTNSNTNTGDQTITLTGMVTGSGTGSFTASLGTFTKADLNTAVNDGNVLYVGDTIPVATGISGLGTGVATALALAITAAASTVLDDTTVSAMVDTLGGAAATGTGGLVRATSPTLVTPVLGVAAATTINKVTLTTPATGSTLTIAEGATLTVSASATISSGTHSNTNTGDNTVCTSGAATTAATLLTSRNLYGFSFNGSAATVSGTDIIASGFGGTGNGFTKFSGPTTAERTKTLRDATDTILELGGSYTPTGTWTNLQLANVTLATPASGTLTNCTGYPTASSAEVTTGTDATKIVTPDTLAGSTIFGVKSINLTGFDYTTDVATGDGCAYFFIPSSLTGMNLISCHAYVITAGTTNTTDVQIARTRSGSTVDMLTTKITIDSTETGSDTAVTPPVVNTSNDDVVTHDRIRIDVDATSTTKAKGLIVVLNFQLP